MVELSGKQDRIWKSWSRKYLKTRWCCYIGFIKSFSFWGILTTYNIGICICIYIYKVSYIHSFFVIFNCNVFSAFHAKHFEIWNNILWNWRVDCFIAQSRKWYDTSECSQWIDFPFYAVFFFSRKLCFLWSPCLLLITESITELILLANLLWSFSWKLLLLLE